MTAKELKDNAKFNGWYEDSTEEVTGYIFSEEDMSILWSQLCKEQRDLCQKHYLATAGYEDIKDAPEPKID